MTSGKIGFRCAVDVEALDGTPLVSNKECAGLVMHYSRVGVAEGWREGIKVKGNGDKIKKGTAIATFVNGRYQNLEHGNHAAFYISQSVTGIVIVEQFESLATIQKRTLAYLGVDEKTGRYNNPSNNGDAFSVIELVASPSAQKTASPSGLTPGR